MPLVAKGEKELPEAFCGRNGSRGSWRSSGRWVKRTSHEIFWVATSLKRCSHETVLVVKAFSSRSHHLAPPPPPPPAPPATPPPAPRSGSDAYASGDGRFGGRSSRDEDPLDPSPPSPRSQLGPKPPVHLYHHHRHSHHYPHNHTTSAGIAALAANASFAGNLLLPANAAFTRRQRLRWAQPPPPSTSRPANPPTNDSNNPYPHRLRRNRDDNDESGGCRSRGSVEAELLLLGERMCYGRGRRQA